MAKKQPKKLPFQYLNPWPSEHNRYYDAFRARLELIVDLTEKGIIEGINRRNLAYLSQSIPVVKMLAGRLLIEAIELGKQRQHTTPKWVNGITDSIVVMAPRIVEQAQETEDFIKSKSFGRIKVRLSFCHDAAAVILLKLLEGPKPVIINRVSDRLLKEAQRISEGDITLWTDEDNFTDELSDLEQAIAAAKTRRKAKGTKLRPARTPATRRANGGAKGEYRYC